MHVETTAMLGIAAIFTNHLAYIFFYIKPFMKKKIRQLTERVSAALFWSGCECHENEMERQGRDSIGERDHLVV